uniref:Uncharacterized protein n=1 Tax=Chromera velia CCMP2878 TaxID=1169474 RepID=A0A0G4HI17_9ALVE|eukprot:Cvel_6933.t1-p1 / transcript=Cvel_6933.t1 / gene=Cvel_6933 / organism=Chromera_velia_CCMP2878 / gene_product=hypothetical protein / transcript_product=hypothetical protein / location=Cvel_scaffold351:20753-22444(+) / protein_length=564 / sequence_SO=supercontig / SO=protein_coding / is_pseudo=false
MDPPTRQEGQEMNFLSTDSERREGRDKWTLRLPFVTIRDSGLTFGKHVSVGLDCFAGPVGQRTFLGIDCERNGGIHCGAYSYALFSSGWVSVETHEGESLVHAVCRQVEALLEAHVEHAERDRGEEKEKGTPGAVVESVKEVLRSLVEEDGKDGAGLRVLLPEIADEANTWRFAEFRLEPFVGVGGCFGFAWGMKDDEGYKVVGGDLMFNGLSTLAVYLGHKVLPRSAKLRLWLPHMIVEAKIFQQKPEKPLQSESTHRAGGSEEREKEAETQIPKSSRDCQTQVSRREGRRRHRQYKGKKISSRVVPPPRLRSPPQSGHSERLRGGLAKWGIRTPTGTERSGLHLTSYEEEMFSGKGRGSGGDLSSRCMERGAAVGKTDRHWEAASKILNKDNLPFLSLPLQKLSPEHPRGESGATERLSPSLPSLPLSPSGLSKDLRTLQESLPPSILQTARSRENARSFSTFLFGPPQQKGVATKCQDREELPSDPDERLTGPLHPSTVSLPSSVHERKHLPTEKKMQPQNPDIEVPDGTAAPACADALGASDSTAASVCAGLGARKSNAC